MNTVFLGLGGNMGDRAALLKSALVQIGAQIGQIHQKSSIYETAAWGKEQSPSYLNMVLQLETVLNPVELIKTCLDIEKNCGRLRTHDRYADRTMDIDVLYYNELQLITEAIEIPHPRMHLRKFVLVPLAEIFPQKIDPRSGKTITELLQNCSDVSLISIFQKA